MKRKSFYILVTVLLFLIINTGYVSTKELNLTEEQFIEIFNEAIVNIKNNFVDTEKISLEKLYFGAIEGALKSLDDPYTRFLPPEKYDDLKMKTTGKFGGLGIVISLKNKILTVVSPIFGTPAYMRGIKPGDQILEIEGEATDAMTLQDAVERMRGEPGTKVTITIMRPEFQTPRKFTITRDIIKIESVQNKILDNNIGYIRLMEFSETSYRELLKAIEGLKKQGMTKLILDLRNNPGGLLDSAYDISNIFLDRGLVVFTRGRYAHQNKSYYASPAATDEIKMPLIILANGGSASGSEIVIGAVKDNKRGLIVGEKTFGKGLVQSVFPFKSIIGSNAGVAITTAKYYTPSGICIQDSGIIPHIEISQTKPTDKEIEGLLKFYEQDYAMKFVKKYPAITDENLNEFIKELKKENIELRRELIEGQIREQYAREDGKHYFADIKTDEVLRRTVELFTTYDILIKQNEEK